MNKTPRLCDECGKSFVPGVEHKYRLKTTSGNKCYCSYTCYRKAQEKNPRRYHATPRRREFG